MFHLAQAPIRNLLATWLAAAWAMPCLAAEPAGRELSEATRCCRALHTELALGIRTREASSDELRTLLARGESLLLQAAGVDQDPLAKHLSVWQEAVARAVVAIEEAKAAGITVVTAREDQPGEVVTIDPWAGPDQECGYFPRDVRPVPTNWDFELPAVDPGQLPEQIPPRFRLAEFLGLGRNFLQAELDWISPQLMRRQTNAEWGLLVLARLHCTVIGRFGPAAGQTTEPRESLETFRILVSSQGLKQFITTRSNLGNDKAYRTEQSNDTNMLSQRNPDNPWWRENLAAAAAERGWTLRPATGEAPEPGADWLEGALQRELASRQDEVAAAVRQDPAVVEALQMLKDLRTSIFAAMSSPTAAQRPPDGGDRAPAPDFVPSQDATVYPELTATEQLVAAGRLDRASLSRLVPFTGRALRAAHHAAWASAAAPPLHPEAAQLARALDALTACPLP